MHQAAADLLEHRRGDGAQLVGAPELLYLGTDPFLRRFGIAAKLLIQGAQLAEDPRLLVDRRAPARLGGMRGHHQPDLCLGEQLTDRLRTDAALDDRGDRIVDRAPARCRPLARLAGADPPHAFVVFRQVDQLKPARERPDQQLDLFKAELGDHPRKRIAGFRITAPGTLSQLDRATAQTEDLPGPAHMTNLVKARAQQVQIGVQIA